MDSPNAQRRRVTALSAAAFCPGFAAPAGSGLFGIMPRFRK
jgi:hypothetical protein